MENIPTTVKEVEFLAPNQAIITLTNGKRIFNSYGANIVEIDTFQNTVKLDEVYWDFSVTTGKYRNIVLGEDKKTTEKKIKNGTYVLYKLNRR